MTQPARKESVIGEINTLLGRGSEFDGKLTFDGTVRIDGVLRGEVFSNDVLIVGEGARVEAEIEVGEIIIQGSVVGNIKASRSIEILAPGRVKGDITTPSLQIDKGVVFEGRSFMEGVTDKKPASGPVLKGQPQAQQPKQQPKSLPKPLK